MANKIQIVITTDNSGAITGIRQVRDEAQKIGPAGSRAAAEINRSLSDLGGTLESTARTLSGYLAAFTGFITVAAIIEKTVSAGIEFNRTIESSRLGIASLLSAQMEFTASSGRAIEGTDKLNAALLQSDKIIRQLQIDNLQTSATFTQLVRAYQQGLSPGLEAGLSPDQIRRVVVSMVQAGGAMGLPLDMMGEELRGILRGTISARNTLIASALGISNEDIRRYQGDAQGLFSFLQEKLKEFQVAGEATQKTFAGLSSNLLDAFQIAAGKGGEPFFNYLKKEMQNLISGMIELNRATGELQIKPEVERGFQGLFTVVRGISEVLITIGKGAGGIALVVGNAVTKLKEQVEDAARTATRLESLHNTRNSGGSTATLYAIPFATPSDYENGNLQSEQAGIASLVVRRRQIQTEIQALDTQLQNFGYSVGSTVFEQFMQDVEHFQQARTLTALERELKEVEAQLSAMGRTINSIDPELIRLQAVTESIHMAASNAARSWEQLVDKIKEAQHIDISKLGKDLYDQLALDQIKKDLIAKGVPREQMPAAIRAEQQRMQLARNIEAARKTNATPEQIAWLQSLGPLIDAHQRNEATFASDKKAMSGRTKTPIGIEAVDQDYSRFVKRNEDMYRSITDQAYTYYEKLAELSGNWEQAEQLKIERQIQNQKAALDRMADDEWRAFVELYQKLNREGRGSTPEAQGVLDEAWRQVEAANYWAAWGKGQLDRQHAMESADAAERRRLKEREDIAQVNVSYTQLTGTMEDQLRAQLALIQAQKDQKLKEVGGDVTELGKAYKRLYEEQERIARLRMDGSFADGIKEAFRQLRNEMPTQFDLGIQAMKDTYKGFVSDLGRGGGDFFQKVWKGEIKSAEEAFTAFCDLITRAFSNAVSNMISKWMEAQLSGMLTGSGGGFSSFIGGILGLGGGGSYVGSMPSNFLVPDVNFAVPGLAGGGSALPGNIYAIGEHGPELLQLDRPGRVIPNASLRELGSGRPIVNLVVNDYSGRIETDTKTEEWDPRAGVLAIVFDALDSNPDMHDRVKRANRM